MKKKKISNAKTSDTSAPMPEPQASTTVGTATPARFGVRRIALALAALTFLVYLRAVFNDWTNFDDNVYITENPVTLQGLTWDNFIWAISGWHAAFWQPLVWLSYQVEVSLVQWNPFGLWPNIWHAAPVFHLTNVVCHTADTVLLFFLVRALTGTVWRSAFVAALFALHPLHVESVAWITERKDVLSAGFLFASLLVYVHYTRAEEGRRTRLYLGTFGLFFCGLMAKPMLVTLPFVMLLLDFWPLQRFATSQGQSATQPFRSFLLATVTLALLPVAVGLPILFSLDKTTRKLVVEKIPFLLLSLLAAVVAIYAVADYNDLRPLSAYPIDVRIWNSIETYCAYIGQMLWPSGLIAFYIYPTAFSPAVIAAEAIGLIAVTAFAVRQALTGKRAWFLAGWLWFLGTLLPVIGIVKTGSFARADRYTYIPLVGLFIIVAWALAEYAGSDAQRRRRAAFLGGLLVALCACLTYVQIGQWAGTVPLFTRMIKIGGTENALAQDYNLGLGYYDEQKNQPNPEVARDLLLKAEVRFREAFRIRPDYCQAHNNLGIVLMLLGRNEESFQNFEIAARLDPTHVPALDNYGHGLVQHGRYPEAITVLEKAVALAPSDTRAHFSLADAYALSNRPREAIPHLAYFLQVAPDNQEARRKLGILLSQTGNAPAAAEQFGVLVAQNPGDALMRNNYGFLLLRAGQPAEAEVQVREAIRLQQAMPEAHNNLGLVLSAQGHKPEAAAEFREALRLRPNYPDAKANLDSALK